MNDPTSDKEPSICLALDVFGWVSLIVALLVLVFAGLGGTFGIPWAEVIGSVLGGLLLIGFAAAIRSLNRIERAIRFPPDKP